MSDMSEEDMFAIMRGMDEVNNRMAKEIEAKAPMCHMRKMSYESGDGESWWECGVCGHTKDWKWTN